MYLASHVSGYFSEKTMQMNYTRTPEQNQKKTYLLYRSHRDGVKLFACVKTYANGYAYVMSLQFRMMHALQLLGEDLVYDKRI